MNKHLRKSQILKKQNRYPNKKYSQLQNQQEIVPFKFQYKSTPFLQLQENLQTYVSKEKSGKGKYQKQYKSDHKQKSEKSDVKLKKEMIKLSTILETGALQHRFPKIKPRNRESHKNTKQSYEKGYKNSRVLTIDTRISDELSILSSDFKLDIKQLNKPQSQQNSFFDNLSEYGNQQSLRYMSRPNTIDRQDLDYSRQSKPFPKSSLPQIQIQEQQTTSDEQYIKDANPGPGSYSTQNYSALVKRTINRSQRLSFCSKAQRFKPKKILQQDSELEKILKQQQQQRAKRIKILNKKQKKYVPFNSQSPKMNYFQKNDNNLSPLSYNPRLGIQEDLIKKIQRNFKGKFGVQEKRFIDEGKNKQHLGPGTYTIQADRSDLYKPSHYFQSKIPRF